MPVNFGFITLESIMLPIIKGQCIVGMKVWRNGVTMRLHHVSSTSLIITYQKKLKHLIFIQMDVEGKIKTIPLFTFSIPLSNSGSVKLKLFTFQINGSLSLKILGFITSLMLCE